MFTFKKEIGKKERESILIKTISSLINDVEELKREVTSFNREHNRMVAEMKKRDGAFMEFLKVELTTVKTAEKDQFGKDFVKSTYKLLKK